MGEEITVRELRNEGGRVLDRVAGGETLVVTRAGKPVAELRPLRRAPLKAAPLVENRRGLPPIDPAKLRRDIDRLLDQSL